MFRYNYSFLKKFIVWEYVIALVIILAAFNYKYIKDIEKLENLNIEQQNRINILETMLSTKIKIEVIAKEQEIRETKVETAKSEVRTKPNTTNKDVFRITAYCSCEKCCGKWATVNGGGITASGTKVQEGRTIAVCTKQIPFGTEVYIEGMGTYIAEDTGSAIKENCIDVYFDDHDEARQFGVKYLNVEW